MSDESRVYTAIAIKLFLEGKDDQSFVDVIANQADASLAPRPELRCDVIDRRNAAPFHLSRDTPVECRGVDHDGEVGLSAVGLADQVFVKSKNFRQVAENFGDTDDGQVFGVDH